METWSNLCRSCLNPDSEVSIFDKEQKVKEKFLETTTIEVTSNDRLPQKLCTNCFNILNTSYQFRQQCLEMDKELRTQLQAFIAKQEAMSDNYIDNDDSDEANDPVKQLEAFIKSEPANDSDDDCYYVLVIDDPKDNEGVVPKEEIDQEIKSVHAENENIKTERSEHSEGDSSQNFFSNSIDSFNIPDTRIPVNVPATILENEDEESQDYDDPPAISTETEQIAEENPDIDSNSQNAHEIMQYINQEENESSNDVGIIKYTSINNVIQKLPQTQNSIIKILTANPSDGTIILQRADNLAYLAETELNEDDDDPMSQDEVILCEGDDTSQFQILKCDGNELVIEYTDEGMDGIATVLQQDDGSFLCECGQSFQDLGEYETHQSSHNPGAENLCRFCGKGFESQEILTGHLLLHSVTGLLVSCPFCELIVRRNTLTQHIKYNHNHIKPKCDICCKTFANPNNLKRHMMIHSGIREFKCDLCEKRFHQKITMQTHRLTHVNPFACNQCDLIFESANDLDKHKQSDTCTKSKLNRVKAELMKTVKQAVTTNVGKLLGYACSICKSMFSVESALEQHVESMHMIDPLNLLCSECGDVLPSPKDMQTHIMTHKNVRMKNMKRFECTTCGKGCASQAMLIMHERVHTNERPYPCQLCSLKFKTKTHLRTHQLTHTREKKFGCSVCMKFFALKGNLVVHLRTHTGERPYVCGLCNEAFIDSKYLKKHKLKKHAIDNVPWNTY